MRYNMLRTMHIFCVFLWRDFTLGWKSKNSYLINYILIYPMLYAFTFLYLQSNIYFGAHQQAMGTAIFVGNILLALITLSNKYTNELMFDLEQNRFIDYQISLLPPRFVLLERITFAALCTFLMLMPYFPVAKLVFRDQFVTTNTSWIALEIMVFVGAFFCSSYNLLMSCILRTAQISQFWIRINQPLLILGGFWVPRYIIQQFSPLLGALTYLNPLMYVTEGLRQAAIGGNQFLPLWICLVMLLLFTCLCIITSFYFFKKRTDHI